MSGVRGILGMRKDPKRQTLFMVGGEEWPSSDSDDTDYEPAAKKAKNSASSDSEDSGDEVPSTSKRSKGKRNQISRNTHSVLQGGSRERRWLQKESKPSKKHVPQSSSIHTRAAKAAETEKQASAVSSFVIEGGTFGRLPVELWMKIFQTAVQTQGALPFLCRVSKVCREWRALARAPALWQRVDLSYGWIKSTDQTLRWLVQNTLSECRDISLSGWKNLSSEVVKEMCEHCPHLETVNVSHCRKLSSVSVTALATHCSKLKNLNLSFTGPDAVSVKSLRFLISKVGSSLRELWLGGNKLAGFNLVLNEVMLHCRHLDTLDLSNSTFSTEFLSLDVEKLQSSCPSLRILGLANCVVRANKDTVQCQGAGFTKLEELSCAKQFYREDDLLCSRGASDSLLVRLLHKAENLRLLDLRGCYNFNQRTSIIPEATSVIRDLEQLYLSRSCISRYGECLAPALRQWNHSLKVLDLSWTSPNHTDLEAAFRALTANPACPLTQLNLAGSTVTLPCVLLALNNLQSLESVDLSSCRALPRGMKCVHSGAAALRKLRASLKEEYSDSDTDSY